MLGQVHDIDIKLLRVFAVIARAGGFAAAQAQLNTSQAFISTQMKNLEARLGTRLCQRGHAGFQLTASGVAVLEAAEKLFAALDEFRCEAESAVDPLLGSVRLGVIDQIATSEDCAIAQAIAEFAQFAPNTAVALSIVPPLELETMVLDASIDMAYGIFHHRLPTLNYTTLGREVHQVYCARGHPLFDLPDDQITEQTLQDCEHVGWDYLDRGELVESPLAGQLRAASPYMEAVLHFILSGRYIGYLPAHMARSWEESARLRALRSKWLAREVPVELVTRKGAELSPPAAVFRETLVRVHGVARRKAVK